MAIYLGLGSNLGDRRRNLARTIALLEEKVEVVRLSPVFESPALLPADAPPEWNLPFLNLALECRASCAPQALRAWIKEIELRLGRKDGARWSPRSADVDILLWDDERIADEGLTIPHPEIHRRSFVLAPLIALQPRMTIPGLAPRTLLEWSRKLGRHIPLWMGIVNVTPDSFSDGGRFQHWQRAQAHIEDMVAAGAHIVDIGAESTRPGARPLPADEEWQRLEPILARLAEKYADTPLGPRISVDTYHPETAARALALGADMINDVGGLTSPAMRELAANSGKDWIAMHSLTLPADRSAVLPSDCDPFAVLDDWLARRIDEWATAGLDLNRIVFDPGIGFGKNPLQSLRLLRRAGDFRRRGLRLLVGHSRKSFMSAFSTASEHDKDLVTVGASLNLCAQGVDVLRVHDVAAHTSAYRGWSHLSDG
jgi:2-amino-4-hydroxy-6-hydroxymethyldihydropteridine diphosphokinase/dihydropteroate synthase